MRSLATRPSSRSFSPRPSYSKYKTWRASFDNPITRLAHSYALLSFYKTRNTFKRTSCMVNYANCSKNTTNKCCNTTRPHNVNNSICYKEAINQTARAIFSPPKRKCPSITHSSMTISFKCVKYPCSSNSGLNSATCTIIHNRRTILAYHLIAFLTLCKLNKLTSHYDFIK